MNQASLFNLMPERHVWKVSELTDRIRDLLETAFPDVWVEGEVSNCHAAQSGHLYFTLKDARAANSLCLFSRPGARAEIPPRRWLARHRARRRSASTTCAANIRSMSRISSLSASALCSSPSSS